uniref:Uncharacterized protein n=1 Tax=Parascaris univalens TaxID=6257 RepID=A0A915B6C4_PARUN
MFFGAILCVLLAASYACPPETSTAPPTTPEGRNLNKRSAGCNPDEVLVEAITKVPFGEKNANEKTDRAIRGKILHLLAEKHVETEKYGDFIHSIASNNGFLTIQYAFANSLQYCGDFVLFGEVGVNEIAEISKVVVTCGCNQPRTIP